MMKLKIHIPWYDKIFLIIQITSYLIYTLLAITLVLKIKNSKKSYNGKHSFYIQFIINLFYDIGQAVAVIFFQKFLKWGLLVNFLLKTSWIHYLYAPLCYILIASSIIGNFITLANRYCALQHPYFYRNNWNKKLSYALISFQIFFPIIIFSYTINANTTIIYSKDIEAYTFFISNDKISILNNVLLAIISGSCSLISTFFNIVIIYKYNKIIGQIRSKRERSKRISICIYVTITNLSLFFLSIQQTLRMIFGIRREYYMTFTLSYFLFWIVPLSNILQPYMILCLSEQLRKKFISMYFKGCISNKQNIDEE
uniref:Serpentine receptor class gamma n=1 Tax=Parastrongyloides trichosuri TaxID=131310 RepID=A0A0N4ZYP8_PARTI